MGDHRQRLVAERAQLQIIKGDHRIALQEAVRELCDRIGPPSQFASSGELLDVIATYRWVHQINLLLEAFEVRCSDIDRALRLHEFIERHKALERPTCSHDGAICGPDVAGCEVTRE